jgi:hypothetical protein
MISDQKRLTDFLVGLGIESIAHTSKTYLGHLIAVYRFLQSEGCEEEVCRAGMFHSIYGTERFQGFTLPLERRSEVRELIGERAERLAYVNCVMDRASFDKALLEKSNGPFRIINRITGEEILFSRQDFDDLCRVHLYDWLEQVPRSGFGWGYRREAYRRIAERLGATAVAAHERVFQQEPKTSA